MPSFNGLQRRLNQPVVFYAFDPLHLDGYDLTKCPLVARKVALKRIREWVKIKNRSRP